MAMFFIFNTRKASLIVFHSIEEGVYMTRKSKYCSLLLKQPQNVTVNELHSLKQAETQVGWVSKGKK